jgi:hypothetical protein
VVDEDTGIDPAVPILEASEEWVEAGEAAMRSSENAAPFC